MEYALRHDNQYESIVFQASPSLAIQTKGRGTITLQAKVEDNDFTNHLTISAKDHVTILDFPEDADLRLVSKHPFSYTIPDKPPHYYNKTKLEDFLYEITYGNIDYAYAYEHFKPGYAAGCSAIRNGNLFGRNFDWLYNNQVQFVVHTPTSLDHYAVLGVSGIIPGVVKSNVDNESIIISGVDMFKLVPFYLLDGINEKGVFCTHNVVPLDDDEAPTQEIGALKQERDRVCIPMLPRFVLDKFATASAAINYLRDYTTLYFSDEMLEAGYQSHFMIGDCNNTYIVEFENGEIRTSTTHKYITNFQVTDVLFDKDKHIIYPPTQSGINKYGSGLERWDIITDAYKLCCTHEGMRATLNAVKFSNCYQDPFWTSEIVGKDDDDGNVITVDTDPANCTTSIAEVKENYASRSRTDPKVWITCHSSIYDIRQRTLSITNQEGETEYDFPL